MSEKQQAQVSAGVVILARTGSVRLPQKSLLPLQGKPVIEHQIERLKAAKLPKVLALATTTLPEDEALCEIAQRCGIDYFQGAEHDVVERMVQAADHYDIEFVASIGGDNVFCDGELVDVVVSEYATNPADYIRVANMPFDTTPYGASVSALRHILEIKEGEDTDGWERYLKDTGLFRTVEVQLNDPALEHPELRLDIDYPEDFELMKAVYDRLYTPGSQPLLRDVIHLLVDGEPSLASINKTAQEDWERVREQTPLSLKDDLSDQSSQS